MNKLTKAQKLLELFKNRKTILTPKENKKITKVSKTLRNKKEEKYFNSTS